MEVTFINWYGIPKRNWDKILGLIPINGYVKELPHKIPNDAPSISIPIPDEVSYFMCDDMDSIDIPLTMKKLVFNKVLLMNPEGSNEYVWQRKQ